MATELLQRVSVRWLPEPAYEDSDTIALNIGGYFMDLRIAKSDGSVQWSRAGERKIITHSPFSYRWTHIIDSLGLTEPDDATWDWESLGNGDAFEAGIAKCPHNNGVLTPYEEVWRNVTRAGPETLAWILQSVDGTTFVGLLGAIYLGMRREEDGSFTVRRDEWHGQAGWEVKFTSRDVTGIPNIADVLSVGKVKWILDEEIVIKGVSYVVRASDGFNRADT